MCFPQSCCTVVVCNLYKIVGNSHFFLKYVYGSDARWHILDCLAPGKNIISTWPRAKQSCCGFSAIEHVFLLVLRNYIKCRNVFLLLLLEELSCVVVPNFRLYVMNSGIAWFPWKHVRHTAHCDC